MFVCVVLFGSGAGQKKETEPELSPGRETPRPSPSFLAGSPVSRTKSYFADADECGKYWVCKNEITNPKLRLDGLAFSEAGSTIEKCEFPLAVDWAARPKLRENFI